MKKNLKKLTEDFLNEVFEKSNILKDLFWEILEKIASRISEANPLKVFECFLEDFFRRIHEQISDETHFKLS